MSFLPLDFAVINRLSIDSPTMSKSFEPDVEPNRQFYKLKTELKSLIFPIKKEIN